MRRITTILAPSLLIGLLTGGEAELPLDGYTIAQVTRQAMKNRSPSDLKAALGLAWILAPLDYRKHASKVPMDCKDPKVYLQWQDADFYATMNVYYLMSLVVKYRNDANLDIAIMNVIRTSKTISSATMPSNEWRSSLDMAYKRSNNVKSPYWSDSDDFKHIHGSGICDNYRQRVIETLVQVLIKPSCTTYFISLLPGQARSIKPKEHILLEGNAILTASDQGFFKYSDLAPAYHQMTLRQTNGEALTDLAAQQQRKILYESDANKLYILLAGTNPERYLTNQSRSSLTDFSGLVTVDYWQGSVPVDINVMLDNSSATIEPLVSGSTAALLHLYPVYDPLVPSIKVPAELSTIKK